MEDLDYAPIGPPAAVATGIAGLDEVLLGGIPPDRIYLIEGDPGSGKTTLGLQFLLDGAAAGERCLYVTLSESAAELSAVAQSHGWSLDQITVLELLVSEDALRPESTYTIFQPSEVELSDTVARILAEVEGIKPTRLVLDSLSEFRLLAQSPLRYRRQTLAFKQFFMGRQCTVLMLDDRTSEGHDLQLHSIAHGVLNLEQLAPEFGGARRRLRLIKLRGRRYQSGYHDFTISRGGIQVFPRLVAQDHATALTLGSISSGLPALDTLMGGGVDRGTSTMLIGPAGSGKSTVAMQYAAAAAASGERVAAFLFDERLPTLLARTDGLGVPLRQHVESGLVRIHQIDPAELSPGEFTGIMQRAVEPESGQGASVVIIDSLNGYLQSMPEERFLTAQLHELLTYLAHRGVAAFLVVAQHGLVGMSMQAPIDATYLADTVVLLRYFEAAGRIRQAISVVKRRSGAHERTLRELTMGADGIVLGEPLTEFRGVLSGVPVEAGARDGPVVLP